MLIAHNRYISKLFESFVSQFFTFWEIDLNVFMKMKEKKKLSNLTLSNTFIIDFNKMEETKIIVAFFLLRTPTIGKLFFINKMLYKCISFLFNREI